MEARSGRRKGANTQGVGGHVDGWQSTAGSVEAYLDGELATSWRDIDTLPAGGFTAAEVGIHYAEDSQGAVEVFVDDVAFGTARMPCD